MEKVMEFKQGDKLTVTDSYHEYYVLKAKKGQTATFLHYKEDNAWERGIPCKKQFAVIELSNGNKVQIPPNLIKPYEKKVIVKIEDYGNEKLVSEYGRLCAWEIQTSHATKVHEKMMKDIERLEKELIKRLNKE